MHYYHLLELFGTTLVSWYCCFCTSDHSTVIFTFTILWFFRVLLLLLFCAIPPLFPHHPHLHLALLSLLMETHSHSQAVEGPSIQLYLQSLTRAWILLRVGDNDPVCYICLLFPLIFCCYVQSLGLKHVSDNQKTHKNPNLRVQASPIKTKNTETVNTPRPVVQKRPPLLELEGKKWRVVCKTLPSIED